MHLRPLRSLATMLRSLLFVVALLAASSVSRVALRAQTPSAASASAGVARSVDGRVRRPVRDGGDSTGMGAATGAWVTLHRVGRDRAGPIDSVRTDAAGRYRVRWRTFGAADAVYFASVTWDGIAYFTAPLRAVDARGDESEITVFDTTSVPFALSVRGRHLIIGKADSTRERTIIEVFELSNDSVRTLVAAEGGAPAPTWGIAVPAAARDVRATEGEISPDAFAFNAGRVSVFAPMAPGLKQVSFSYKLPAKSFPAEFVAEHGAVVFEILLEEPMGTVTAPGFANVDPVTLERRNFRRYLAQDVKDGVRVLIDLPASRTPFRNLYIAGLLVAIGCLMLLMLLRAVQARKGARTVALHPAITRQYQPGALDHERLAQEIAALDALLAQQQSPTDEVRLAYERRRAELKASLADALAAVPASR